MEQNKKAKNSAAAWDIQETYSGESHGWIQWKGTNVCMDVHCKCGALTHVDVDFAYHVKCIRCGTVYMCNGHIELIELMEEPENCVVVEADNPDSEQTGTSYFFDTQENKVYKHNTDGTFQNITQPKE